MATLPVSQSLMPAGTRNLKCEGVSIIVSSLVVDHRLFMKLSVIIYVSPGVMLDCREFQ